MSYGQLLWTLHRDLHGDYTAFSSPCIETMSFGLARHIASSSIVQDVNRCCLVSVEGVQAPEQGDRGVRQRIRSIRSLAFRLWSMELALHEEKS